MKFFSSLLDQSVLVCREIFTLRSKFFLRDKLHNAFLQFNRFFKAALLRMQCGEHRKMLPLVFLSNLQFGRPIQDFDCAVNSQKSCFQDR